jgi:predicted permease
MKRALTSLVAAFPSAFREEFAGEMVAMIGHEYDAARTKGRPAALWYALATATDLTRSAVAERWSPTWARTDPPAEKQGMRWIMNEWGRDIRHAARALRRSPGFTATAVGTLGLAIGANAGMFSVVNTVLLDPLPYASSNRLVHIAASAPGSDFPEEFGVASEFYVHYRENSKLLEDVSTYNSFTATLRVDDRVERVRMSAPTNSLFSTLGATPAIGRLPVAEDESRTVVISHALWQAWFGGDSAVLGRAYEIAGGSRTIIGVMRPDFAFPLDGTLLWISGEIRPEGIVPGRFGTSLVARMAPEATPDAVARELTALAKQLPERFGGSPAYARLIEQHRAVVRSLEDQVLGAVARPLWVLLSAALIVLLIACANVANLFLVRAEGRQRDLAVRRAIGAARSQLVRLQMAEAVAVAALAGGVAALLATISLPAFLRAAPAGVPRLTEASLNGTTLAFTLLAALLSALACGVIPALRASAPDLTRLRDGGRGSTRKRHWARDGLVVAQTSMALVLLIASGLLVRSYWELRGVDPGYDTHNVFTFQIAPEGTHLPDAPAYARFHLAFLDRLKALPGVESVGLVENVPLNESTASARFLTEATAANPDAGPRLQFTWAGGAYFRTMGIALISGRAFVTDDHLATPGNVVISQSAAKLLWPGEDPIGRRIRRQDLSTWETVIGVVEDVMQDGFREPPAPLVYFPLVGPTPTSWIVSSPAYVVKTPRTEQIASEVRALLRDVAPEAPMYRVFTMDGLARDSMVAVSFTMLTLGIASALALILGAVGLYGVLSYIVAQRTKEIGVRMALGAEAAQVRQMVVAQGARVVAVGVVVGLIVALASTRALGSLLFGVAALDPVTFAAMSVSMVLVGMLASYVPARRASRVDPIESLRGD